jgi:hypothetical protein
MFRPSGGTVRCGEDRTLPPTAISPAEGSMKPAISRNVVVLPHPDGPSRQTSCPCPIINDTSSTATASP